MLSKYCSVEGVWRQFMTMQWRVTLHSKESAIVRCVIADSKHYSKKVSPYYCPAMDTKKLKKRGYLKIVKLKKGNRDPEKSN